MGIIGTFIQVGLLWLLITIFTGSTNSQQSLRETWVVIIGVMIAGLFTRFIPGDYAPLLAFVVELVVLFFLVERIFEVERKIAAKICGWYVLVSIVISLFFSLMFTF